MGCKTTEPIPDGIGSAIGESYRWVVTSASVQVARKSGRNRGEPAT